MTCPAYGSSSNISLYYAVDSDPALAISGDTITWNQVPITSESLSANLTSSISEQINATRSFANSVVTQGEISGSFGFEAEANTFVTNMLKAALQADGAWAKGEAIRNGLTPTCYMFLKKVIRNDGTDYFVFRGVQVDSLSLSVAPGSLITGEVSVMGTRVGAGVLGATDGSNDILNALPGTWTLDVFTTGKLMSSIFSLQKFEVQKTFGRDIGVVLNQLDLSISNQLRQQFGVGTGSPYAAGVASGRIQVTLSGNAYYSNPAIINAMLNDSNLRIMFSLLDADGEGWQFLFNKAKVTSAPPPAAAGPDQDTMSSTEFQAFESTDAGSISIMRIGAGTEGSEELTNGAFTTNLTDWSGASWAFFDDGGDGTAKHTAGATAALTQTVALAAGSYRVTFTVKGATGDGFVYATLGDVRAHATHVGDPATSAVYSSVVTIDSAVTSFNFVPSSDFNGRITSASVKPITWA